MDRGALTRRSFVQSAIAGGALLLVDPLAARSRAAVPLAADIAFGQGVASGEPTPRAITLWTALDGLEAPARLTVEVSDDPGFGRTLLRTEAIADPAAAGTARVRLAGGPLAPGGQYCYRFASADGSSPIGRFRTTRPAGSRENVTIAFFSCQELIAGYYHAHADLVARDDVDLVVCLGDYIYEQAFADTASVSKPVRVDASAPDGEAETLAEYRAKYRLYHSDTALRAVRARFPIVAITDDHEVEDNYAGDLAGGAAKHRQLPFAQRRANGYRAWHEAMPRLAIGDGPTYNQQSLGVVDLFSLDTRRYRDDQPCSPSDGPLVLGCAPGAYNAPRTLLGAPQKAWLKTGLKAATAPWKIIANQAMIMSLDLVKGSPLNTDSWDGYGAERSELLRFIAAERIAGVSFVTGDIHTFFAGDVTPTGRLGASPAGPARPVVATEFVGSAITSPGIVDRVASAEEVRNAVALALDAAVQAANPHITYSNQSYKGYGILRASPSSLKVTYRAVHDTRKSSSSAFTLATFTVAHDRPHVEVTSRAPIRLGGGLPAGTPSLSLRDLAR